MNQFIFDVDGTLTPSRQTIDLDFAVFFKQFCKENNVYLITGSDRNKTIEQVGEEIYNLAKCVYNCSGSDVYKGSENIRRDKWKLPEDARIFLLGCLKASEFKYKTDNHLEQRSGMLNFSIVGRSCTQQDRKKYCEWDKQNNERNKITLKFNKLFPKLQATVGGQTGIDIAPHGANKGQILKDFDSSDTLHFFGDAMGTQGNDYPLKKLIIDQGRGLCYTVNSWKDTKQLLYERTLGRKISS
ncbi:MAG TPA: hypothetical protein DEG69_01600 [Flavobacteriaceae bacterium]|nr:hypothetical protein [Flavobacteriaceae bacterium]